MASLPFWSSSLFRQSRFVTFSFWGGRQKMKEGKREGGNVGKYVPSFHIFYAVRNTSHVTFAQKWLITWRSSFSFQLHLVLVSPIFSRCHFFIPTSPRISCEHAPLLICPVAALEFVRSIGRNFTRTDGSTAPLYSTLISLGWVSYLSIKMLRHIVRVQLHFQLWPMEVNLKQYNGATCRFGPDRVHPAFTSVLRSKSNELMLFLFPPDIKSPPSG